MKLVHISVASLASCLLGLLVLVVITLNSVGEVRTKQEEIAELLSLQTRINDFTLASSSLLLFGADDGLLAAYRDEGEALQQRLLQMDVDSAGQRKTAHRIEQLLNAVRTALGHGAGPDTPHHALDLPARSLIILHHAGGLGGAVNSALDELLRERQRVIAREAWWIGASLAGAALLFGLLTMIAFLLIHRRVAAPARVITRTLSAIRGGNPDARADVRGADELAELSRTLNQMLDERQLLDERLSEHNERLRQFHQLLDNSEDLCGIADGAYRYLWVNQTYRKSFGLEQHEIEKLTIPEVLGQDYFEQTLKPRIDRCLAGEAQRFETERYSPGLGARNLLVRYYPIDLPDRSDPCLGAVITDVTEIRATETELAALLESRKALINSLPAHIALVDAQGTIVDVNDQWRHFGEQNAYSGDDFGLGVNYIALCESASGECADEAADVARGLRAVLEGKQDSFSLEYPCHSPEQRRWFRVTANRMVTGETNGADHGAVVMHVDITERKLAELEIERIAFVDPLTGLYSRNGFVRQLQQRLDRNRWPALGAVMMIDIVGQRDINAAYGYEGGDRLLVEFGRRLEAQAGRRGLAGRVTGDEFTLLLLPDPNETLEARLDRLIGALTVPFEPRGSAVEVSIRLGYTQLGERPRSVESLLREAEQALFQHREEPSLPWVAYSERFQEESEQRIQLTSDLRTALKEDQLELHFQPKVDLASGTLVACEALLRWNHPERGLISPLVFIPVAEQSQLIAPIGDWVLRRACQFLREWRAAGLDPVRVAVNVSIVQFQKGDFSNQVRTILDESGVRPEELALEITESVFSRESVDLLRQMRALREMGVRLCLDDFGTGYSSLLYLQRYPFDEIKIDQGFVFGLLDDAFSRNIVETVLVLARALGAEVMAEGIESAAVSKALQAMGCRYGQGYFYSMPLEAEDFRWLLEQRSRLPLATDSSRQADRTEDGSRSNS